MSNKNYSRRNFIGKVALGTAGASVTKLSNAPVSTVRLLINVSLAQTIVLTLDFWDVVPVVTGIRIWLICR